MDILLGKVSKALYKILCSKEIDVFKKYRDVDFSHALPYSPHSTLDDDQWFYIESPSAKKIKNPITECTTANSNDWVQITADKYSSIRFLVLIDKVKGRAFYQKVPDSLLISKPKLGIFGLNDQPTIIYDPIILINEIPDAIYYELLNRVYFRDISKLTNIFLGIDQQFKAATEEEVSDFVNSNIFNTVSGFDIKKVPTAVRKKITLVKQRYDKFKAVEQAQFISNVQQYLPNINFKNGKFIISNSEDVRDLADALDQKFHNTPITNEPRRTQSYRTLK